MVKLSVQLSNWKSILCQALEAQMLTSEGHVPREEGLVGASISRVRVFPAEGAAASEPWPTVPIWPVCDISREVRNLHFYEVFFFFCFTFFSTK